MRVRPRRLVGVAATGIATVMLGYSCLIHLVNADAAAALAEDLGAPAWFTRVCGVVLSICLVAYLVPRTAPVGAVLLTGYLSGACTAHLALNEPSQALVAVGTGVLVWAGLWPRDARVRHVLLTPVSTP